MIIRLGATEDRLADAENKIETLKRILKVATGNLQPKDPKDPEDPAVQMVYLDAISSYFSEEELRSFILDLNVMHSPVGLALDYEALPASSKIGKALELMSWHKRHGRLPALYKAIEQKRPFLFDV